MTKKILVVSAHLGDEILGCGGTLAKHIEAGDDVRVAILGEGWTSRARTLAKGLEAVDLEKFEAHGRLAHERLGIGSIQFHRLPDNRFDAQPLLEIVKIVESEKERFGPDKVYTNSAFDLGVDQRLTCQACQIAFRPQPGEIHTDLMAFEVRASTEWNFSGGNQVFSPNLFIDIEATLARKIEAFRCLSTEVRPWPHARSLEAIEYAARARGSEVGLGAAEAFALMRSIRKQP